MKKKTKIIFMGTPQFAVPFLSALIDNDDFEVVAILTQPDKPIGRKQTITPPPVKLLALKNKLTVLQPENLKNDRNAEEKLKALNADLFVVVAYGQIIPQRILDIPPLGNINVHPSLLPKYRGASPIQNAILEREKTTGVTIMLMDEKMDHGPILAQQELVLDGTETSEDLHDKTSGEFGTKLLINTISDLVAGKTTPQEQDHKKATYCKQVTKAEAQINWNDSAEVISAKIRGFYSWPIAWTTFKNKRIKILPPVQIIDAQGDPGEIKSTDNGDMIITTSDNALLISTLQLEGKNKTTGKEFLLGHQDLIGKKFK